MSKYRIIEEKNSRTSYSFFYIQVKRRFLFYTWWERVTERRYLNNGEGFNHKPTYLDLDIARKEFEYLTKEKEIIIHT
jgi:hypothetical protein